ncbi:MAG TPA: NUDIX hydrolase [Chloroflexaceae bacterium]|nr:NUDIX hydrolase [Chloroflexaceae bacterium]
MRLRGTSLTNRGLACVLLDCLADAAPTEAGRPGRWVDLSELRLAKGYDQRFAAGFCELLGGLGLLELCEATDSARAASVNAGYALRLLGDLLSCDEPVVGDWEREGLTAREELAHPFGAGVDLLAALELRRLELLSGAAPVRELQAAMGLLVAGVGSERRFLLCYDAAARSWQLPGGRYEHQDRSLRATLLRELAEELGLAGLREPDDLTLEPLGQRVAGQRLSPTRGVLTRTVFHFFLIRWAGPLPLDRAGVRWVSERELRLGRTDDGQQVSAEPLLELLGPPARGPAGAAREARASALALG